MSTSKKQSSSGRVALLLVTGLVAYFTYLILEELKEPLTHYDALRVSRMASREEVRKHYKALSLIYHPDKVQASLRAAPRWRRAWRALTRFDAMAPQRFIAISEAHDVLTNEERRRAYDAVLDTKREEKLSLSPSELIQQYWYYARSQMNYSPINLFLILMLLVVCSEFIFLPIIFALVSLFLAILPQRSEHTSTLSNEELESARALARERQQAAYEQRQRKSSRTATTRRSTPSTNTSFTPRRKERKAPSRVKAQRQESYSL